jgi:uncharacterized protein
MYGGIKGPESSFVDKTRAPAGLSRLQFPPADTDLFYITQLQTGKERGFIPLLETAMRLSRYVKTYTSRENPSHLLIFSTRWLSKTVVPQSLMRSIEEGSLSPESEQTLRRLGILVPDQEAERLEMLGAMEEANRRTRECRITAVLNLDCNLACSYCFEGNRKGKHYMSVDTAAALVEFAIKNCIGRGRDLAVDFYGGEPLLSLEVIRDISCRLKQAAECKGVGYSSNIITNGTLFTGKVAEELAALGLKRAKITLDGPRENHDAWRPFVSGNSSFDVILKNIKDVCGRVKVQTGGNFTRENYREFPRLLDTFQAEGITPDKLASVVFVPITKTLDEYVLPEFSEGCISPDEPWLIEAGIFLREEVLRRGFPTPKISTSACVVEHKDCFIVNHDGAIFKCPALIGRKDLEIGDLWNGIKDYSQSHNLDVWKKDECLDCAYLPLCFGGCRFVKLMRDGAIDGVECR